METTKDLKIIADTETSIISEAKFWEFIVACNRTHFFGVRFDNLTKKTALKIVRNFLTEKSNQKSRKIFFTNVHTIYLAGKNPVFAQTVNNADLVLPDGSGLKIAGKIFSKPVKENLNGTDFTPLILEAASRLGSKIYLLGATKNVITECVSRLERQYRGLKIAGYHSGFFSSDDEPELINEIKNISPDILLVAMGSPKQEMFADKIARQLNNTVCCAVGGFFDFVTEERKRAPLFIRKTGLEWLFRFIQDPKTKWDRILIEIPVFLLSVFTARFFTNSIFSSSDKRPW
ncbi:MAG: WecB/TagA/CpsF family glycosyltransferase [Ignavibacteriae bacterium]|nr:WecB/TagA/CpsF family glycosyltransferase [Ignavibacteriota bacterium]